MKLLYSVVYISIIIMSMLGNIASILSLHEVTTKYMVWYGSRYIGSVAYMAH